MNLTTAAWVLFYPVFICQYFRKRHETASYNPTQKNYKIICTYSQFVQPTYPDISHEILSHYTSHHNPTVFEVHLHPAFSTPRLLYDYKHANWPLFRSSIDLALDPHPTVQNTIELHNASATFTQTIRQAATHAIPVLASRFRPAYYTCGNSRSTIVVGINELAYPRLTTYTTSSLRSSRLTSLVSVTPNGLSFYTPYGHKPTNSEK
jgi:hypothetical protein